MPDRFLVHEATADGPATHALVIGVGAYPHLRNGGARLTPDHDGMNQLTSPPISARAVASWLIQSFHHPEKPLASVALLASEAAPSKFVDPRDASNSLDLETANMANVAIAIREWFARGDTNAENLMLFYFCGHGIAAGLDAALLLSDYGADHLAALDGALNFRVFRNGMQRCRASEQCYFVDACRSSTDTLVNAESAGRIIVQPRPRDPTWPRRRAPVFYASMKGDKAFSVPGESSIFTSALLKALNELAADDKDGDWRVKTTQLQETIEHLVERRMADDFQRVQIPTSDDLSTIPINFLQRVPNAIVYVEQDPPAPLDGAALTYVQNGGPPKAAPSTGANGAVWTFEVPAGSYKFAIALPGGRICEQEVHVKPAYRRIKMKVDP